MDNYEVGEIFSISDENGEDQEVEVVGTINEGDTEYIAVSFVEDMKEENEDEDIDIFYLKVDKDGYLSAIESDEEFEKVSRAFEKMIQEEE
jgi:uncharacterized protein YrzB (UPF0473 family)